MVTQPAPFLRRSQHLLLLLIYPLYFWGFQYVEHAVPVAKYVMYTPADDSIPFVPLAIYPYLFWYLYIGLAIAFTGFTDAKGFVQLLLFLYVGMGLSYVIYLLFPNGQNLRPDLASLGQGLHFDLIRWLYRVDTPTNSNPSMHVIDSMAVYLVLKRDPRLAPRRIFQGFNLALNLVIVASTLLVKQHSIIDVLCALALSWLLYLGIMRRDLLGRAVQFLRDLRPAAADSEADAALVKVAVDEDE